MAEWSKTLGWKGKYNQNGFFFTYDRDESAKFFVDLFSKNNTLIVRHNGNIRRFQIQGFWDAVTQAGLTKDEIMNAIFNDSF